MYEMAVSGEIKALAWREGSSGIFTGSIEGLYLGHRLGSEAPDERHYVLEAPNGNLALTLRQEFHTPLPPRPAEHPFADGKDPFADLPAGQGRPPAAGESAPPSAPKIAEMEILLSVDPEKSTGIFAGATGQTRVAVPNYRRGGQVVITTGDGILCLHFLETAEKNRLLADLWVDSGGSTGRYHQARGELHFVLTRTPPNFGRGPYWGTLWLQQEPPPAQGSQPGGTGGPPTNPP
jgi:hypothetical protein